MDSRFNYVIYSFSKNKTNCYVLHYWWAAWLNDYFKRKGKQLYIAICPKITIKT